MKHTVYRGVDVPEDFHSEDGWKSEQANQWRYGVDDAMNTFGIGRLDGKLDKPADPNINPVARVAGAARFLRWLQKNKRYRIGGYQRPDDWQQGVIRPVTTPAAELLAEYVGHDINDLPLPDDVRDIIDQLFPISREKKEQVDQIRRLHASGEITYDEMRRQVREVTNPKGSTS